MQGIMYFYRLLIRSGHLNLVLVTITCIEHLFYLDRVCFYTYMLLQAQKSCQNYLEDTFKVLDKSPLYRSIIFNKRHIFAQKLAQKHLCNQTLLIWVFHLYE